MGRRNAVSAVPCQLPPTLPDVRATRETWVSYGKKLHKQWANVQAQMGSQQVLLQKKTDTIDDLNSQLSKLRSDMEELHLNLRGKQAAARKKKHVLSTKVDSLTQQLEAASSRRQVEALAVARRNIEELTTKVAKAEADGREQVRNERSKAKAEMQQSLQALADSRALAESLQQVVDSLRSKIAQQGRQRQRVGPLEAETSTWSNFRARAADDLTQFMENKYDGGVHGDLAVTVLHALLSRHPASKDALVEKIGVKKDIQQEFQAILRNHWSVETCAAIFIHGGMTHREYQAVSNIMCGTWDDILEKFNRLLLPDGKTPLPRWASLHKILAYIKESCLELGLESLEDGQAAVLDIKLVLRAQLEYLLDGAIEPEDIPEEVPVQLAADCAGWHKKPSDKIMKNFTAFVAKVIMKKLNSRGKVGEGINSCHNNRLAMLYAGQDCHHLLEKFLNAKETATGAPVSSLTEQLSEISAEPLETKFGMIAILWRLGGDLKFLVECFGLCGNASKFPCHQCTCRKEHLWRMPAGETFPADCVPIPRTLELIYKLTHSWGAKYDLTQPYECPGCHKWISEDNRHPPVTAAEKQEYPHYHFSHQFEVLNLFPGVEPEDVVPDILHGFIRSVVNMFFISISMNIYTQASAEELATWMTEDLKVSTVAVWNQASRDATIKTLQKWTGRDCWRVMNNIADILEKVFPDRIDDEGQRIAFDKCTNLYNRFIRLLAIWLLDIGESECWGDIAGMIRVRAKEWRNAFVRVAGSNVDCTPTMHSIIYHYAQMYGKHGPLVWYCMQGLEAKHQPIKRAKRRHCNKKGFLTVGNAPRNAAGKILVHSTSTDIMQVARRCSAADIVSTKITAGHSTRKRGRDDVGDHDQLSALIKELQQDALAELNITDAQE